MRNSNPDMNHNEDVTEETYGNSQFFNIPVMYNAKPILELNLVPISKTDYEIQKV